MEPNRDHHAPPADGGAALQGYDDAVAIERGPLVFALPIDTEWKKVRDRENLPFDDWEVLPEIALEFRSSDRPQSSRAIGDVRGTRHRRGAVFSHRCAR